MRRFAVASLLAVAAAAVPIAGQAPAAHVSTDPRVTTALEVVRVWLEAQRAYDQIPGVSAAVIHDQDQLWLAATATPIHDEEARRRRHDLQHLLDLEATAPDLGRFASWQFRLLARGGTEVLNANTLREMHRVHVDPDFEATWGLGFSVIRRDGKSFVGHGGSCPGFQTELLLKTDDKIATVFMANAQGGVNTATWAYRMYEIVAPAIRAAKKEPDKAKAPDPDLERYLGSYEGAPYFSGEVAVVRWEDGLALLSLPTLDPVKNLTKLKKIGEHRFRRIRSDESLGEEIVFEIGPDGKASRFTRHNNYYPRVKSTT